MSLEYRTSHANFANPIVTQANPDPGKRPRQRDSSTLLMPVHFHINETAQGFASIRLNDRTNSKTKALAKAGIYEIKQ